jgi:hypothetical protein
LAIGTIISLIRGIIAAWHPILIASLIIFFIGLAVGMA